ncbi:MAG TPA: hemolysin family protein [Polyangiaceae bacterium]|nr:hemolysin family protein [Polyangiaceae bacterium]
MLVEFGVIFALVLMNGVLAGAEIAVVRVDRAPLKQLAEEGKRSARIVEGLRENPERFFAAVQIGVTLVTATASAFGGSRVARHLEPIIARVSFIAPIAPELSFVTIVGFVSFLTIVFGELIPKSLALRHSTTYALAIGPLIQMVSTAARPLVWFLTTVSNAVLALFGDSTTFSEARVSPDELLLLVNEAAESGSLHPAAGEIVSRALELPELTAADVMVPRARVVGIKRDESVADIQRIVTETGYSRLPVYGENLDEIVGYVLVKDFLAMAWERQLIVLDDLIRPAYFVVEGTKVPALLQEMRRRRVHLAIVVDEHGGTSGIVTMEDVLEELVGEIVSELADAAEPFRRMPDGSILVRGDTPIRDLNRLAGVDLPESDDWSTIAGLSMALAGRVPREGAVLSLPDGTELEVRAATDRTVREVRIRLPAVG